MRRRDLLGSATVGAALLAASNPRRSQAQAAAGRPRGSIVETVDGTRLAYRDWGSGPNVLLLTPWGFSTLGWQYVMVPLMERGYRCISYDRRGHGSSSDPGRGYEYDTLADDLATLVETLDLQRVTLVAHSISGGEAIRYITRHGAGRVERLLLVATTLPFPQNTADNPHPFDAALYEQLRKAWRVDFPKWLWDNSRPFFLPQTPEPMIRWTVDMMSRTSLQALLECNRAMASTDFRPELRKLKLPVLLVHGDKDASMPLEFSSSRVTQLVSGARMKVYPGGPHGLPLTHPTQLADDIVQFMRA